MCKTTGTPTKPKGRKTLIKNYRSKKILIFNQLKFLIMFKKLLMRIKSRENSTHS